MNSLPYYTDVPTILAMMRAADAHMDALRAAVERLAAENAALLKDRDTMLGIYTVEAP